MQRRPETRRQRNLAAVACSLLVTILCGVAVPSSGKELLRTAASPLETPAPARAETLWIFDADFEDFQGCNSGIEDLGQPGDSLTGWFTYDFSPRPAQSANWHVDTFRCYHDGTPPDSSYWCGRRDSCWNMDGYGDYWLQYLWRDFDLRDMQADTLRLIFRQRVALEKDYDYGYVDIADLSGSSPDSFRTVYSVSNIGWWPGYPIEWDHPPEYSHPRIDIGDWLGQMVRIRWRLESDSCYSSEHERFCRWRYGLAAGGWYIDEVAIVADLDTVFLADFDDPSQPANQGWRAGEGGGGQVGVVWQRVRADSVWPGTVLYQLDGDWLLAAIDREAGFMSEGQSATLVTPPFGIAGIEDFHDLVLELDGYFDFPFGSQYALGISVGTCDSLECLGTRASFCDPLSLPPVTEPGWYRLVFPMDPEQVGSVPSGRHMRLKIGESSPIGSGEARGLLLDRLRVGATSEMGTDVPAVPGSPSNGVHVHIVSPFFPPGRIGSVVHARGHLGVELFDLSGRLVRKLLDESVDGRGCIPLEWDGMDGRGRDVASGVYFLRVTASESTVARKVVLVK